MIKKIKEFFRKKRDAKRSYEYFMTLKQGAAFLKFIYDDLEKQKKGNFNRDQRRRIERHLKDNGKINAEIVQHYASKVDSILAYIQKEMKK